MRQEFVAPRSLAALKPFQRATVDYVFDRLFGADAVDRFLVADEVGLGKTLVARGVIAKAIDRLRARRRRRIDIVYICSNADIADQNLRKLHPDGHEAKDFAMRVTLLPDRANALASNGLNFISFTPGTSFTLGDAFGRRDERLVLYRMLRIAWGPELIDSPGAIRILRGDARYEGFLRDATWYQRHPGALDRLMVDAFSRALGRRDSSVPRSGRGLIRREFEELATQLRCDDDDRAQARARAHQVGRLRRILARTCIAALKPSLVILDEFQRYRSVLVLPDHATNEQILANELFLKLGRESKTLLLSATPYRMYTLSDETDTDDHYADFIKTMEYLLAPGEPSALRRELRAYREALLSIDRMKLDELGEARDQVAMRLRRVMCRTERLAVDDMRGGMLDPGEAHVVAVTPGDIRAFIALDTVSNGLRAAGDSVEYWKSTPYALSFMESYDVRRRLEAQRTQLPMAVGEALRGSDGMLRNRDIKAYRALDAGNPRLRAMAAELLDEQGSQPLWIPPSLPYYGLQGHFASQAATSLTKRLIFSAWTAVPQAIASVLSYEAERRMLLLHFQPDQLAAGQHKPRTLLAFRSLDEHARSMTTFAMLYPSPTLARLGDPLSLGEAGTGTVEQVLAAAEEAIEQALEQALPPEDNVDDRQNPAAWYWAAPLLLDRAFAPGAVTAFFGHSSSEVAHAWAPAKPGKDEVDEVDENEQVGNLALHVDAALEVINGRLPGGPRPKYLVRDLARLAVGGPAVCALRSLWRVVPTLEREDPRCMASAARMAWGFRSLYRQPEVAAMIRGSAQDDDAYWSLVLDYNVAGCLQAVLDEYLHVLPDVMGRLEGDSTPLAASEAIAEVAYRALTLRAARYSFTDLTTRTWHVAERRPTIGSRYARRFGVDATDEGSVVQRSSRVREAFNSPFWPFVLATTSVGQEGLDFHLYCHRVVHWNLPANPVDLEQREGRVHRYKGHALRRNVAHSYRAAAFAGGDDPWGQMFRAAADTDESRASSGIRPYWVSPGPFRIERDIPVLPFSREIERYRRLCKSRAVYRQVIGLAAQEDLVEYLLGLMSARGAGLSEVDLKTRLEALRVDLTPPPPPGHASA